MGEPEVAGKGIPGYYKHAYKVLCPSDNDRIGCQKFIKAMSQANITREQIQEVWDKVDTRHNGSLSKSDFYHALAYVALCQRGERVHEEVLRTRPELPEPNLGDMDRFLALPEEHDLLVVDFTHRELEDLDFIQITTEAKKSGTVRKHQNYNVYCRRFKCSVVRRYSDFESLDDKLRKRYAYRIIPSLPGKGGMLSPMKSQSQEFIEVRRKKLCQYLTSIARHPVLREDPMMVAFLSESDDIKSKLNSISKTQRPEWETSPIGATPLEYVDSDAVGTIEKTVIEMGPILERYRKLEDLTGRMVARRAQEARDWLEMKEWMGDDTCLGEHVAGPQWNTIQASFKKTAGHLDTLHERTVEQHMRESDGFQNRIACFVQMLEAYLDMMERRMKTVEKDLGRIKSKVSRTTSALTKANNKGENSKLSGKLEAKLLKSMSSEERLEQENDYSIYCLWAEGKLIKAHFAQLGTLLEEIASSQMTGMKQLVDTWAKMTPGVTELVEKLDIYCPYPNLRRASASGPSTPISPASPF
eukprot:m.341394 g.341394  ORF g.341394 m.341394 type:complete len:528 (+) comp20091_c0_seq1:176-1759(+)